MKQFTCTIFIFFLITCSSQAQRGWRLFDQFGGVYAIDESKDGTLWVWTEDSGLWHYDDGSGWQKETQFTDRVNVIFESSDATLWLGGDGWTVAL